MRRVDKSEEAVADRHENSDIIYSQDLVVKNIGALLPVVRSMTEKVVNFKCFRKVNGSVSITMISGKSWISWSLLHICCSSLIF